jgi:hypothetical protein
VRLDESADQHQADTEAQPRSSHRDETAPRAAVVGQSDRPAVSVVIPVLNDAAGIRRCVAALRRQSYPEKKFEIIVVDNGSTDDTGHVVSTLDVRILQETSRRSSYAARNAGLRESSGDVLAFTDADCTPSEEWIEMGVRALEKRHADLVGGHVQFELPSRPSGAEIWDSVTNMQIEQNVRERGVAKTANLFVRRTVFDAIGPFSSDLRSGGDVAWTGNATRNGFTLVFAPDARVSHPTRRLRQLVSKQFRVGSGQATIMRRAGDPTRRQLQSALRYIAPPTPDLVTTQLKAKLATASPSQFTRVWMAAWLCRAATGLGALVSAVSHTQGRERDR